MPNRKIKAAAVQMNVTAAPVADRLARAELLVTEATDADAQIVVLPEVFNTGYQYDESNYKLAEPPDGVTLTWMKRTAARYGVYLAGSLLLKDHDEVYNSLMLVAPDGRIWRYDKNYPFAWEYAYFRSSDRITVAQTDLGDIGMMICWDVGHPDLWARYAGRVDLMIISSSPPGFMNGHVIFPDGRRIRFGDLSPTMKIMEGLDKLAFKSVMEAQASWLGVPAVCGSHGGVFESGFAAPIITGLGLFMYAPWMLNDALHLDEASLTAEMVQTCKVLNADGQIVAQVSPEDGEKIALAEVTLAESRRTPSVPQPRSTISSFAYLMIDAVNRYMYLPAYRKELRAAWGDAMSPRSPVKRWNAFLIMMGLVLSFLIGALIGKRKRES